MRVMNDETLEAVANGFGEAVRVQMAAAVEDCRRHPNQAAPRIIDVELWVSPNPDDPLTAVIHVVPRLDGWNPRPRRPARPLWS